jgi:hypothetical protein
LLGDYRNLRGQWVTSTMPIISVPISARRVDANRCDAGDTLYLFGQIGIDLIAIGIADLILKSKGSRESTRDPRPKAASIRGCL